MPNNEAWYEDWSWLIDARDYAKEFFGFEERPPYEPGYVVPVGAQPMGMEKYIPWVVIGFLGVFLVVALRK